MKITKISQQNKMLALSFLILILVYFVFAPKKDSSIPIKNDRIYADTLIPKGFVLIPIELANAETVSALMFLFQMNFRT